MHHCYAQSAILYQGVFTNRSETKFRSIEDGTSNTLLFGEAKAVSGEFILPLGTWAFSWMGNNVMSTLYWGRDLPIAHRFRSNHPGVTNFAFADASVKPLSLELEADLMKSLAGKSDGSIASLE